MTRPLLLKFSSLFLGFLVLDILAARDFSYLHIHLFTARFVINFFLSALCFLLLLNLWRWPPFQTRWGDFIFFLVIALPLFLQLNHFAVYREFVGPFAFSFLLHNFALSLQVGVDHIEALKSIVTLLFSVFIFIYFRKLLRTSQRLRLKGALASGLTSLGILTVCTFAWYGVHEYQESSVAFASSFLQYATQKAGALHGIRPLVPKQTRSIIAPSIVWIVGESAVKSHMQIYGYQRPTTPHLLKRQQANELIAFRNVVSVGNKTMLSVPYMLYGLQGPDPEGRIYNSANIFAYAKAVGYETALISAQEMRWYNLDKLLVDENVDLFLPGPHFAADVRIMKGADDLLVVNTGVLPYLEQPHYAPFLLIYQMDGSHYPYQKHSPQQYKIFAPEDDPNSINAYDNSLVYSDIALDRIITAVKKTHPEAWIFYSSDHGQNLGAKKYNSDFSPDVIANPLFVVAPTDALNTIRTNEDSPVSQADIFATVLDLMGASAISPIDGISLRTPIPHTRMRVCSTFMPTFENEPESVFVYPDFSRVGINYRTQRLRFANGDEVGFESAPLELRNLISLHEKK